MDSFLDQPLGQTPFLVVDLETTGLIPGRDRVVEIAAVSVVPGTEPRVVLDTLVDPGVEVARSDHHGVTCEEVRGAPCFPEVGKALRPLLANRVLACHHLDFDRDFLLLEQTLHRPTPGLCTLALFQSLMGERRNLGRACSLLGVCHEDAHSARGDALGTAHLLRKLLQLCRKEGLRTLRQLMEAHEVFRPMLDHRPLNAPATMITPEQIGAKPRKLRKRSPRSSASRQYLEAVVAVLSDFLVEPHELEMLEELRAELGLSPGRQRAVHARVFNAFLTRYTEDQNLDPREVAHLETIHRCLRQLGWAPGDGLGDEN